MLQRTKRLAQRLGRKFNRHLISRSLRDVNKVFFDQSHPINISLSSLTIYLLLALQLVGSANADNVAGNC